MTNEMVEELLKLAANTATAVAGVPTEMVIKPLTRFRDELRDQFIEAIGFDAAEIVASSFMKAVLESKLAIENSNPGTVH